MAKTASGARATIGGYVVEMDDSDGNMNCYVTKGNYTASLACVGDTGELSDAKGRTVTIDYSVLDRIEQWAEANGY